MATKKILLINSDPSVREVMQACLSHIGGWQVCTTGSPTEGLKQASHDQADAIIFDLSTFGMTFLACLKQLRKQPETRSIPVVLIASGAKWLNIQLFQSLQVVGVIDDLSDPDQFSKQIATFLDWEKKPQRLETEDYGSYADLDG
jgi:CheY-like chemotaxis protein